MVAIEFREGYVRHIGKIAEKNLDTGFAKMEIPATFIQKCLDWHKANPEKPKTRPMTEIEKLDWAIKNMDCMIFTGNEWKKIKSCCINEIAIATKRLTFPGEKETPLQFEIEVKE
jgi:hypothetical protein